MQALAILHSQPSYKEKDLIGLQTRSDMLMIFFFNNSLVIQIPSYLNKNIKREVVSSYNIRGQRVKKLMGL